MAVREQVRGDAHGRPRREDVVAPGDVLLEDVVLDGAAQLLPAHPLPLGDQLVQEQEQRCGRVDRHRGRHLAERNAGEHELHVGERVDRHAGPADLPGAARVVRVVAQLRGEVERDRKARLAALEQVAEARVRLLGRAEAGVLADRPRPSAVHVRVRPARERELARRLELDLAEIGRGVDGLDLDPGVRMALVGGGHAGIVVPTPLTS